MLMIAIKIVFASILSSPLLSFVRCLFNLLLQPGGRDFVALPHRVSLNREREVGEQHPEQCIHKTKVRCWLGTWP
ncbi:hypothetical protein POJ06DRAFT_242663 [Lipomyces tetrasporus]|uniref:Uncharacterized protein n=1 Tax=Lipomyces tetrasporus TaxID=54092 RepID=A0AAD7VWN6_9ASCO|nr:uncharacterized protein POJ06DRAFT_242663 [Lipomyces tetrasporus]KAJ8103720.1 hypothetical protein POJ06DRAFT_242663 [Lipomyces tetrasporus]